MKYVGKNIMITGTSKGIGNALAKYYAQEGANVFAVSRTLVDYGYDNITPIVESIHNVNEIIKWLKDNYIIIDILINNAGIIAYGMLNESTREDFERVFDTNVISTYLLSKEVAKMMYEERGEGIIVNTHSFAATIPSVGSGIYAASKAALTSLTRTMAAEWAPYSIRVNGYSPGVIETDMTIPAIEKNHSNMINAIAQQRIGNVEDVIGVVSFLTSNDSKYLSGVNIDVSGGKYIVQNAADAWERKNAN